MEIWHPGRGPAGLRRHLDAGGVLAIPTESSYGLAADPGNPAGVEAVFHIKRRPADKALLVVAASLDQIDALGVRLQDPLRQTLDDLWPAPLTVVLPLVRPLAAAVGQPTLAIRIPRHRALRDLCAELGPLTATSANRSGEAPIRDPRRLAELLAGHAGWIIDGGVLPGGAPSTLLDAMASPPRVLRAGNLELPAELGEEWSNGDGSTYMVGSGVKR
ncbi:MAG: L-threonylcarbamoyladenylate synthase [Acidobacteriota bacterium]